MEYKLFGHLSTPSILPQVSKRRLRKYEAEVNNKDVKKNFKNSRMCRDLVRKYTCFVPNG